MEGEVRMFVGYAGLISRNVTSFAAGRIAFAAVAGVSM